ncbi:acyl-CoA dehydrogenase family protein [Novosphingobium sp.]|uniref:acyl-CoA dehydrogenase family protein n=1 Tax=Novosphingobium sp. TaxID=1874826 RepID=UPI003BA894E2
MNLEFSPEELEFRDEVRAFLAEKLTPRFAEAGRNCAGIYCELPLARDWFRVLAEKGWSVPHWPVEHGGTGWSPAQHVIFKQELAMANAPPLSPNSTHMVAPVIIAFGTAEQKAHYLPRIRLGEDWWAQGYSEPNSGSDLASLALSAVRDGDVYVLNGSKTWTTHAHFSNKMFCLVRTDRTGKPQQGISFLLFDLDLPGIEIRPIVSISGDHELNEVFFTDVRVPVSGIVGQENDGWTVAKYLLRHERSTMWSPLLRARLERIKAETKGCSLAMRQRIADADIRLSALEISELRMLFSDMDETRASLMSSISKVSGTELRQHITELGLALAGRSGLVMPDRPEQTGRGVAVATYLNDRAASIYAGTNEVQRDIIAKIILR